MLFAAHKFISKLHDGVFKFLSTNEITNMVPSLLYLSFGDSDFCSLAILIACYFTNLILYTTSIDTVRELYKKWLVVIRTLFILFACKFFIESPYVYFFFGLDSALFIKNIYSKIEEKEYDESKLIKKFITYSLAAMMISLYKLSISFFLILFVSSYILSYTLKIHKIVNEEERILREYEN